MTYVERNGLLVRHETKSAPVTTQPGNFGLDWMLLPNTAANVTVNPSTAIRCAPYAACLRLYVDALRTLPVKLNRRLADGGKEAATDHPLYDLIHDAANPWTSAGELRAALIGDAIDHGNGLAVVVRDGSGNAVELHRVDPSAFSVDRNRLTSEPVFRVHLADGGTLEYGATDAIHIASPFKAADGLSGVGFPSIAREAIALAIILEETGARLFANYSTPSGILTTPYTAQSEQVPAIKQGWRDMLSGSRKGDIAILPKDTAFQAIERQPMAEGQFLEQRAYQLLDIARVFGVPPSMIGDLDRATWANASEMNRAFLQHSLLPWLVQFEEAFTRALLTPEMRREFAISFVTDGFTRASITDRATAYGQFRASGVYTANELRALEDLPAHPEGDTLASPHTTSNTATPNDEAPDAQENTDELHD